jgi:hypothetical protein
MKTWEVADTIRAEKYKSLIYWQATRGLKEEPKSFATNKGKNKGLWTLPAITLQTIKAFLTAGFSSRISKHLKALRLVEVVKTPIPPLSSSMAENPFLMIRQTQIHIKPIKM